MEYITYSNSKHYAKKCLKMCWDDILMQLSVKAALSR